METVLIILAIIWIIVPIAMKKKQQQAKAEEAARQAARQRAQQAAQQQQRPQQSLRTAPLAPSVRPSSPAFQPSFEGIGSQEGQSGPVLQGEQPHEVMDDLKRVGSTLTEAKTGITHTVTVSSESGHAHEETSASGIVAECPPDEAPPQKAAQAAAPAAMDDSAFGWDVAQARTGLVMAEILGPCLALRD